MTVICLNISDKPPFKAESKRALSTKQQQSDVQRSYLEDGGISRILHSEK